MSTTDPRQAHLDAITEHLAAIGEISSSLTAAIASYQQAIAEYETLANYENVPDQVRAAAGRAARRAQAQVQIAIVAAAQDVLGDQSPEDFLAQS